LLDEIYEELYMLSCEELAEKGIVDDEVCEYETEITTLLEEMSEHAPIPGMEIEYEETKRRYEEELERIHAAISDAIYEYADEKAYRIMYEYQYSTYSELASRASDDWVASELKQLMDEYCETRPQICMQAYMLKRER